MTNAQENLDLIWGAAAIGKVLGCSVRKTYHMLESGALPCCKQVGNRWVASRKALEAFFAGVAA
ncbi:Helix-turn-helix domain-containing protein [Devosia crocina]|uniref:Helix-turn-helix domain-containing protein n=1 Tax=Devosia crocina TaxID=429728 RepID=A0A1I7NC98_9HYPH|nr:helix-turn-helix domain-containing protein [Devosia crocina]SFV32279.1 Helix-turn-helix domain-containing protein [Devosia crocina]